MNGIKTGFLLAALTALLLFIGYALGGFGGLIIFLILAAVMNSPPSGGATSSPCAWRARAR